MSDRTKPLSAAEEKELIIKAKYSKDKKEAEKATQEIIMRNYRLVSLLANKYTGSNRQSFEDLVQIGIFGIYPAIEKFNENSGYRFSTYASFWIKQEMRQYLSNHSRNIRTPTYVIELNNKAKKAFNEILTQTGIEPSSKEVSEYLKEHYDVEVAPEKLDEFSNALLANASLDFKIGEESTLADVIEDKESATPDVEFDQKQIKEIVNQTLSKLTVKEERVIRMRFGLGSADEHTLESIAETLSVTKERVRQIEKKALEKLGKGDSLIILKSLKQ